MALRLACQRARSVMGRRLVVRMDEIQAGSSPPPGTSRTKATEKNHGGGTDPLLYGLQLDTETGRVMGRSVQRRQLRRADVSKVRQEAPVKPREINTMDQKFMQASFKPRVRDLREQDPRAPTVEQLSNVALKDIPFLRAWRSIRSDPEDLNRYLIVQDAKNGVDGVPLPDYEQAVQEAQMEREYKEARQKLHAVKSQREAFQLASEDQTDLVDQIDGAFGEYAESDSATTGDAMYSEYASSNKEVVKVTVEGDETEVQPTETLPEVDLSADTLKDLLVDTTKDRIERVTDSEIPIKVHEVSGIDVRDGTVFAKSLRKTARSELFLVPNGTGRIRINGKDVADYFHKPQDRIYVSLPFIATQTCRNFDVVAEVAGGGLSGQAQALRNAIARALAHYDRRYKSPLEMHGLLEIDMRQKERKKIGFLRARKKPTWVKR
ncbi:MAG: hypothetical protein MHM6MM_006351 [Cercozoa sp. M6MM]